MTGIAEEILSELEYYRSKYFELVGKKETEVIMGGCQALSVKPLIIRGIYLSEGYWNGVWYPLEEIKKAVGKLKGKPFKVKHGTDWQFRDKIVGRVTKDWWDDDIKAAAFEAEITDERLIPLIKTRIFFGVSVKTTYDQREENGKLVARNLDYVELSSVDKPACKACVVSYVSQELCEKYLNSNEPDIINEVMSMFEAEELKELENIVFDELQKKKYPYPYPCPEEMKKTDPEAYKKCVQYWEEKAGEKEEILQIKKADIIAAVIEALKRFFKKYPYYRYYPYYFPYYYRKGKYYRRLEDGSEVEVSEQEVADYKKFMAECMKEKTMKECAQIWKEQYAKKYVAPKQEDSGALLVPEILKKIITKLEDIDKRLSELETSNDSSELQETNKETDPGSGQASDTKSDEGNGSKADTKTDETQTEPSIEEQVMKEIEEGKITASDLIFKWINEIS